MNENWVNSEWWLRRRCRRAHTGPLILAEDLSRGWERMSLAFAKPNAGEFTLYPRSHCQHDVDDGNVVILAWELAINLPVTQLEPETIFMGDKAHVGMRLCMKMQRHHHFSTTRIFHFSLVQSIIIIIIERRNRMISRSTPVCKPMQ